MSDAFQLISLRNVCKYFARLMALAALVLSGTYAGLASAQIAVPTTAGSPFFCDARFYQVRADTSASATSPTPRTYLVRYPSLATGATPDNPYTGSNYIGVGLNALGYNPRDSYLYALSFGTANDNQIYRIGQTGAELVGTVTGLPAGFVSTGGVFDKQGRYYFAGQGGTPNSIAPSIIYRIDNIPASGAAALTIAVQYALTAGTLNMGDFAFSDASDGPNGVLYGSLNTTHYRIQLNATTPSATAVTSTLAPTVGGIGSAFYDRPSNKFYVFNNGASTFYEIGNYVVGAPTSTASTVNTPSFIPTGYNNSATDGTSCIFADPAVKTADIAVQKAVVPLTPVTAGQTVTFTIAAGNLGTNPAQSVTVADPLPSGLTFVSASATSGAYVAVPGVWTIPNLASGVTHTLTIVATVNTSGTTTASFVNIASVTGSNQAGTVTFIPLTDPVPGNNTSTASVTVSRTANLAIAKTNGTTTLAAGSTTAYTITVSNLSGFNVADSVLKDPVAPGLSCTTVPTCAVVSGTATCPATGVAAGQLSMVNLQGAGVLIPLLNVGSSIAFVMTCGVTATGL
jgi:uncharacterized repeat protein (TIGR01451 family)